MIDPRLVEFLEQGLSLHLGTRDGNRHPAGGRAAAVSVDPGLKHLVVYIAEVAAARLVPHLETSRQATVGFGRPEDERACQIKGTVVEIRPARPDEEAIVRRQWQGCMEQFEIIGINRDVAAGWACWPAVAVRIEVTAVFEQTPGPQAGVPFV